jgi:hypothetical protein
LKAQSTASIDNQSVVPVPVSTASNITPDTVQGNAGSQSAQFTAACVVKKKTLAQYSAERQSAVTKPPKPTATATTEIPPIKSSSESEPAEAAREKASAPIEISSPPDNPPGEQKITVSY